MIPSWWKQTALSTPFGSVLCWISRQLAPFVSIKTSLICDCTDLFGVSKYSLKSCDLSMFHRYQDWGIDSTLTLPSFSLFKPLLTDTHPVSYVNADRLVFVTYPVSCGCKHWMFLPHNKLRVKQLYNTLCKEQNDKSKHADIYNHKESWNWPGKKRWLNISQPLTILHTQPPESIYAGTLTQQFPLAYPKSWWLHTVFLTQQPWHSLIFPDTQEEDFVCVNKCWWETLW